MFLVANHSELWTEYITPLWKSLLFDEKYLHPLLKADHNALTLDDISHVKCTNALLDSNEGKETI